MEGADFGKRSARVRQTMTEDWPQDQPSIRFAPHLSGFSGGHMRTNAFDAVRFHADGARTQ
ncbi:hypothetical protein DCO57_17960 [Labrenzia sp. 011]|nr:hypothetical protein DCO57_17960 [Labrenzia sp. 011]